MQEFTLRDLEAFQTQRLEAEYADFIARSEYQKVCTFFFGRVYNGEDSQQRDEAFKDFYKIMNRILGGEIARCMRSMIDLQMLTHRLDVELHQKIISDQVAMPLTMDAYERAYSIPDHYEPRRQQITLLENTLVLSNKIFHRWGVGTGLKALHRFNQMRGDDLITGFLLEGYDAFRSRGKIEPLAAAVKQRETERLERIFATYAPTVKQETKT